MSRPARTVIKVGERLICVTRGDITTAHADAIVNAANEHLAGGGGVDGAIHRAAGPSVLQECRAIGGCRTGEAVATTGGKLPARHIIHAVAPRWRGGAYGEQEELASAYRRSLEVADEVGAHTLAFPSLGTVIYGNPIESSARIALQTVGHHLKGATIIDDVTFYLFSDQDLETYQHVMAEQYPS